MKNKYNCISLLSMPKAILIVVFVTFTSLMCAQTQAPSIQTGVTFQWVDTQLINDDAATIQSVTIGTTVYNTFVVPTGYEFDLATAGITGKVIDSVEVVSSFWGFPAGATAAVAATFYGDDPNNPDNLVYREDPVAIATWWARTVDYSDNPGKKVRFMLDPFASAWVWSGNIMYLEQVTIRLIDEADAKCGTRYNPSPEADLNGDCIVDADWLRSGTQALLHADAVGGLVKLRSNPSWMEKNWMRVVCLTCGNFTLSVLTLYT